MTNRQTIIEFQAQLLLGEIIQAQDMLEIPNEDMPEIMAYINSLIHDATNPLTPVNHSLDS